MDRLDADVRWVTNLLFPEPASGRERRTFRLIGDDHLRHLLPGASNAAAARAVVRPGGSGGPAAAMRRVAAWIGVRSGLAQRSAGVLVTEPGGDGIHEYLAAALGLDSVMLAVALGPPRPNRKPVLGVFDGSGHVVGYAKVGWNPLTSALVIHEADFLSSLDRSRLRHVEVPQVIHRGSWRGHQIVLLSPLASPSPLGGRLVGTPAAAAVAEVAALDQAETRPLIESPYWKTLLDRTETIVDRATASRARAAIDILANRYGTIPVALGRWHGDWAPWNMAPARGRLRVWDWERTAAGYPLGLDAIHFEAQRLAAGHPIDREVVTAAVRRSTGVLAALGVADAAGSGLLAAIYPLELHVRYAASLAEDSDSGPVAVPPVPGLVTA